MMGGFPEWASTVEERFLLDRLRLLDRGSLVTLYVVTVVAGGFEPEAVLESCRRGTEGSYRAAGTA